MTMMKTAVAFLLPLFTTLLTSPTATAQFSCTISATDESSCLDTKGDDGGHCVWCSVASFGFCVSEDQAEAAEQTLPSISCDRYSGNDDDQAMTDDTAPKTDDTAPKSDDNVNPADDAIPSNYWTCLQKKDAKTCASAGCTWCDTKGGFGLCMTGPTADSAADSDWFTCNNTTNKNLESVDPMDTSCMMSYLQDQTHDSCVGSVDLNGDNCQWCDLNGLTNLCLTSEQAQMGAALGITCDAAAAIMTAQDGDASVTDPYDPSCLVAFLQDQTEDACKAAVDEDGAACEFCTMEGTALQLCLTEEQAEMGQQLGIDCDASRDDGMMMLEDPYDPSCLVAFLSGQETKDACVAAVDEDGAPCQFCSFNGQDVCLNADQADMAQQFGVECDSGQAMRDNNTPSPPNLYDPSCLLAILQDESATGCTSAVDQQGQSCEYCTLQGVELCLTEQQAQVGQQIGVKCDDSVHQADALDLPSDFFTCLQNYGEAACSSNGCTWCNTEVGMGFCLSDPVAESTKQCTFFDCEFHQNDEEPQVMASSPPPPPPEAPLDTECLAAGMGSIDDAETACNGTQSSNGTPCVWCDAAGVFGLCVSADQVSLVGQFLQCDGSVATASITAAE